MRSREVLMFKVLSRPVSYRNKFKPSRVDLYRVETNEIPTERRITVEKMLKESSFSCRREILVPVG